MVKLLGKPILSALKRRIFEKTEWKVPMVIFFASCPPAIELILSVISFAALLVKVSARILNGSILFSIMWAMRYVKTLVFPEPAPAITIAAPYICFAATFWLSFSSFRKSMKNALYKSKYSDIELKV